MVHTYNTNNTVILFKAAFQSSLMSILNACMILLRTDSLHRLTLCKQNK